VTGLIPGHHASASNMARSKASTPAGPPRIEYLRVENYRALRNVELKDLTPLTVLLGPNAALSRNGLQASGGAGAVSRRGWVHAHHSRGGRAGVPEFLEQGAKLGHLWLDGHLGVGDPLANAGAPARSARAR
jgi:hypothetical protein